MNLLFSYLVFYLGKIYVYVFTKIPTLYDNLYLCESAEVFLYSEIETKKSFKNDQGVTRFLMPSLPILEKSNARHCNLKTFVCLLLDCIYLIIKKT